MKGILQVHYNTTLTFCSVLQSNITFFFIFFLLFSFSFLSRVMDRWVFQIYPNDFCQYKHFMGCSIVVF